MASQATIIMETRIPTQLAKEMQQLVKSGWYADENDIMLDALRRFLVVHRATLLERHIREDIIWGLQGQE